MKQNRQIIITCEHAVNTIPKAYRHLFQQDPDVLNTHRAIDFGAIEIARTFQEKLHCPLFEATTSRLLIECNRSLNHPKCFSEFTKALSTEEKQILIEQYYQPLRGAAETYINDTINKGIQIIHLSIHSFTPVYNHIERNADIGLLYDPTRRIEKQLATIWRSNMLTNNPTLRVRMNYPYKGISDGFVSALRKKYPETHYVGFEVESNQAITRDAARRDNLAHALVNGFSEATQGREALI